MIVLVWAGLGKGMAHLSTLGGREYPMTEVRCFPNTARILCLLIALPMGCDLLFAEELTPVLIKGKWGYMDSDRELLIPAKYEFAGRFHEGLVGVKLDGKFGYIDQDGEVVIDFTYEEGKDFGQGMAPVSSGMHWGYIDKAGRKLTKERFLMAWTPKCGRGRVHDFVTQKHNFVNTAGKLIHRQGFDDAMDFSEGLAPVKVKDKWGYIDFDGKMVIPAQYTSASGFRRNMAEVEVDGKSWWVEDPPGVRIRHHKPGRSGIISKTGEIIIPLQYEDIRTLGLGIVAVKRSGEYRLYSLQSRKELAGTYEDIGYVFSQGLLATKKNDKWGYVNTDGRLRIPYQFDIACHFTDGPAPVLVDKKWGLIDTQGRYVVEPTYDSMNFLEPFPRTVTLKGETFLIDKKGKRVDVLVK